LTGKQTKLQRDFGARAGRREKWADRQVSPAKSCLGGAAAPPKFKFNLCAIRGLIELKFL
jgi:hypothetical protein